MRLADAELPAHFVAFLGLDEPGEAEAVQTAEDEALSQYQVWLEVGIYIKERKRDERCR